VGATPIRSTKLEGCRLRLLLLPFTKRGVAVCTPAQAGGSCSTQLVVALVVHRPQIGCTEQVWDRELNRL